MADQKFSSILIECVGDEVAKSTPVTSRDGLNSIRDGRCLRMMGVRLKSGDIAKAAQVTAADWVRLGQFFWGLGHIETFHSGLKYVQLLSIALRIHRLIALQYWTIERQGPSRNGGRSSKQVPRELSIRGKLLNRKVFQPKLGSR